MTTSKTNYDGRVDDANEGHEGHNNTSHARLYNARARMASQNLSMQDFLLHWGSSDP
jgi:hypothetical protein